MYVSNPLVCRMGRGVFFQFRLATGWFRSRCRPLESRSNWGRHSWLHQVSFPEDIGQRATGDFACAMEAGMVSPASVPESSSLQTAWRRVFGTLKLGRVLKRPSEEHIQEKQGPACILLC